MKTEIDTTPEQDELLVKLNLQSNPDGNTSIEDFTKSFIQDLIKKALSGKQVEDAKLKIEEITSVVDKLTTEDLVAINAITAKYI